MPNHVHLILVPSGPEDLTLAVGRAHWAYVKEMNERREWQGSLFQGRFYSTPMSSSHLIAAVKYVLRNPVRSGLCENAWDYSWSSAAFHTGEKPADPLVVRDPIPDIRDWKEFLSRETDAIDRIRSCTRKGVPFGDDSFLEYVEQVTGLDLRPARNGRPPDWL